jgi:adenylate cyclase
MIPMACVRNRTALPPGSSRPDACLQSSADRRGKIRAIDTTVLFADITGSSRLYEQAGDAAAAEAIRGCLQTMHQAAELTGGRIVKHIGDEIMVLFPDADHAAQAAMRMHLAVSNLPPVEGQKLALRIGFHSGPVVQRDGDVFGDTVNLASRLASQATRGQVLLSADTVAKLSHVVRGQTRKLYEITVRGKADDVALCELLWLRSPDITVQPGGAPPVTTGQGKPQLRLRLGSAEVVRQSLDEPVTIGRGAGCTIVVSDTLASRNHCVIERRQSQFLLKDHSSNGTYVAFADGAPAIVLHRTESVLHGQGWITLGQDREDAAEALEFSCEQQ